MEEDNNIKNCKNCHEDKNLSCFTRNTGLKSYKNSCNKCLYARNGLNQKEYLRNWHKKKMEDPNYVKQKREYSSRWSKNNPEKAAGHARAYHRRLKEDIIREYGGECACCGIDIYEFLTIDHISGNGKAHREKIKQDGVGGKIYRWLKKHGFPKDNFQLLCMNCNAAKGFYNLTLEEIRNKLNTY